MPQPASAAVWAKCWAACKYVVELPVAEPVKTVSRFGPESTQCSSRRSVAVAFQAMLAWTRHSLGNTGPIPRAKHQWFYLRIIEGFGHPCATIIGSLKMPAPSVAGGMLPCDSLVFFRLYDTHCQRVGNA